MGHHQSVRPSRNAQTLPDGAVSLETSLWLIGELGLTPLLLSIQVITPYTARVLTHPTSSESEDTVDVNLGAAHAHVNESTYFRQLHSQFILVERMAMTHQSIPMQSYWHPRSPFPPFFFFVSVYHPVPLTQPACQWESRIPLADAAVDIRCVLMNMYNCGAKDLYQAALSRRLPRARSKISVRGIAFAPVYPGDFFLI